MIDVPTFVACLVVVGVAATLLYQHFNAMFELQYELTNDLLAEVKPLVNQPKEYDTDFLYGVTYELSEE
tara:strand:- start:1743 stop:1949 length:207 start_codon:yes stop_codon:yes gene_type:complete